MAYYAISFLLYGKFASWRDSTTTAVAKSYIYPSNTNIIGIIGASFGISEEKKLIEEVQNKIYGIGVKSLSINDKVLFIERLYNYSHLTIERIKTIQMWEYIINPVYKIFIITESLEFAKKLVYYLENPEYPVYLGRHELLGRIDGIELKENINIVTTDKDENFEIENTHIEVSPEKIELSIQPYTIIQIAKKLRCYNISGKFYDQNQLIDMLEIVGKIKIKGIKLEMYDNIPIVKVKNN